MRIAALLTVLSLGLAPGRGAAELDGETYRSAEWRITISGPKGWDLSEQNSYPSILLWMLSRRPAARMLFAAEEVDPALTAQEYANRTAKALEDMGYATRAPQLHSATGAYWLDFDDGKAFLRQALLIYRTRDRTIGFSLTLSTFDAQDRSQLLRAFDTTLRSVRPIRTPTSGSDDS